ILVSVFTGWRITRSLSSQMLGPAPKLFAGIWFWVMRLVLPVVVAYIGLQYTAFSLTNLCESGSDGIWCSQPATVLFEPGEEALLEESAPTAQREPDAAGEIPEEAAPAGDTEGEMPAKESEPGENAPKDGEILYHSV
ncbi:MAG: sodium-dependent transporter, partial [Marinobacter alexandrii]